MRSAEQVSWDFVQEWLASAEEDLLVARELMERERVSYNPVGFHAQQAAEKLIKGLLTRHQIAFPKTHDIEDLLILAEKAEPGIHGELRGVDTLTPYGVDIRYPGERPALNREEAADAMRLASQTRTVVLRRLESYLRAGRPGTTR
jgi:HEPN domain-containing protein